MKRRAVNGGRRRRAASHQAPSRIGSRQSSGRHGGELLIRQRHERGRLAEDGVAERLGRHLRERGVQPPQQARPPFAVAGPTATPEQHQVDQARVELRGDGGDLGGRPFGAQVVGKVGQGVAHGIERRPGERLRPRGKDLPRLLLQDGGLGRRVTEDDAVRHHVDDDGDAAFRVVLEEIGERLGILHEGLDGKAVEDEGLPPRPLEPGIEDDHVDVGEGVAVAAQDRTGDEQVRCALEAGGKAFASRRQRGIDAVILHAIVLHQAGRGRHKKTRSHPAG